MPVTDKHPDYLQHEKYWQMVDDALIGEAEIKKKEVVYLPKSAGMVEAEKAGDKTGEFYNGYLTRAMYEHWVKDAARSMGGLVSRLLPEITLPKRLESLKNNATNDGFGLNQLFVRVVNAIITKGRVVLVADYDDAGKPMIASYSAESAINWKECNVDGRRDLILTVLAEQRNVSDDRFSHETEPVYRVLSLIEGVYVVEVLDESGVAVDEARTPSMGEKKLDFLPVVFCGSTDNAPDVDEIPLLTMCKAALKHYQLGADYYQELHHTSHPQPWVNNLPDDYKLSVTGVMAAWSLPPDSQCGYLEISGAGIEAKRQAMLDQRNSALESGAKVMDTKGQESGEARKARQNDQHASLHSIVITAAEAIEQVMRIFGQWEGLSPEVIENQCKFTVKPDFASAGYDVIMGQQLQNTAMAGKVSWSTYWEYVRTGKVPDHDYEHEQALIENPNPNDVPED